MRPLRIATFNVRAAWGPAQQAIGHMLAAHDIDVICLQECWPDIAAPICAAMGGAWRPAQPAGDAETSNAIVSRLPLRDARVVELVLPGPYDARAALLATCAPSHNLAEAFTVCCTHLDQQHAAARLAQWAMLRAHMPSPALLCGDLNALQPSDYSHARWQQLAATRARSNWEPPTGALLEALTREGFRDAWRDAGDHRAGAAAEGTCAYATRVDYILASAGFPGRFVPGSYRRCATIEAGLSDHALVYADVVLGRGTR